MAAGDSLNLDDFAKPEGDLLALRERLTARLAQLRRRLTWQIALEGCARVLVVLVALALLGLGFDMWLELSIPARTLFLLAIAGIAGWVAWKYLYHPLARSYSPIEVAGALDKASGAPAREALAPRVATVLQLPVLSDVDWHPSRPMIDRAVRANFAWLESIDFFGRINRRHLMMCAGCAVAGILIPLLLAGAFPATAQQWGARWFLGSNEPWPRDTTITVVGAVDGTLMIPRGETTLIRVQVEDKNRPTETVWMRLEKSDNSAETVTLENFGGGEFRYEMLPLEESVVAHFWGGDGRTAPVTIEPHERPRINSLQLTSRSPRDKESQSNDFSGEDGSLALFPKTSAELTLTSNVPIDEVTATSESSSPTRFERVDDKTWVMRWTHDAALRMRVALRSAESGLSSHPRPIVVGLKNDQPPRVTLSHTGVSSRVTAVASIPLNVVARDDLGLSLVSLNTETTQTQGAKSDQPAVPKPLPSSVNLYGPNPPTPETSVELPHREELEKRKLAPGDQVQIVANVVDDCYSGAQTTRSRTLVFRVVAAEELFREILLRQQQLRSRLRKTSEEATEFRDALQAAELPKQAGDLLRKHRIIQRDLWQVSRALNDSATEMQLNRLGGAETYELISQNVLNPLTTLHDGLVTEQRQAVEKLAGPEPEPMEQLVKRQENIVSEMQKILKNMQQWDSFIDVVNQLNSVIKLEERIRDKTDELRKSQIDRIFDK